MSSLEGEKGFRMNKESQLQHIRIVLAIAGKDILDAIKNKTTISVLISALFVFLFYLIFPILEQENIIDLYAVAEPAWISAIEDSNTFKVNLYDTQEAMQYRLARRGEQALGLVLPTNFDQLIASGAPVKLQGYLLNWISEKQASRMIENAEMQIAAVVGTPVDIVVDQLFMLPESTGSGLNRGVGSLLIIMMTGIILIPHLMLEEKRSRTIDALLISPATAGQITLGKALAGFTFCLLGCGLVLLFNRSLTIQWGLAILASLSIAMFSVALGLFLGAYIINRQQMLMVANITIFPLLVAVFLSIETELIPAWLGQLSKWLPTTAAFDLLRASFTPQTSTTFVFYRVADILVFIVILLGLVAWKIRHSDRL